MKVFSAIATLLLAGLQALPPLVGPLIPDNTAVVTGIVRRADTSRPISEAQVALMKSGETVVQAMTHASVTDGNGRFTIKNVGGGDYRVIAQAEGYFKPADDTPTAAFIGKDIYVFEGQSIGGLIFELIPGATISGRVESLDGERLALAPIEALQANYVGGRMSLQQVRATTTDDLGEYRLFWVPPGEYFVRGRYRASSLDRPERYEPVFFPGIADEESAPPVTVTPASEASAVDMRLSTTPIGGVAVTGRVTDAELAERNVSLVFVVPRDRTVTLGADASDAFKNEAPVKEDGQFLIRGVPPGEYNLFPVVEDDEGYLRTARMPIEVEDKNIEGLSAGLAPAVELRGTITLDGKPSGRDVVLVSLDGLPGALLGALNETPAKAEAHVAAQVDTKTGEFVFRHVHPGRYAVRLAAPVDVPGAYVADLRQKDRSVFDGGVTVGEDLPEPLELILRTQGATVTGTVYDSTLIRPFARATVALVPDDPHRRNFALYKTTLSAADGSFSLEGIAPGTYKLFAWQTVTTGAWENAAFLRRYEDRGVAVVADQNTTETLKLIAR